jgi:hypothetical protein
VEGTGPPVVKSNVGTGPQACGHSPKEVGSVVGSVIKKRRKRMAKKKHRKLLKRTRVQRRNKK